MKLLTAAIRKQLPKLYSTEKVPVEEKVAIVKFFHSNSTWYAVEGQEKDGDFLFFGYVVVVGQASEWGYFSLNEMQSVKVRGLGIERDLYWTPTKMGDILSGKAS